MKTMILAAGLGTRLKPLTDKMPKALVPVAGRPLLQILLERLYFFECTGVVINVHHFADMIEQWCANYPARFPIKFSDERQRLLETGGAIRHAVDMLQGERFLVHNVDILSSADLSKFYSQGEGSVATLLVSERDTQRYLLFDKDMRLVGWTNVVTGELKTPFSKLDLSRCKRYAFSGIHQIDPILFSEFENWPQCFSIVDFYLSLCHRFCIRGYVQPGLELLDVGKLYTLTEAEQFVYKYHL